MTLANGDVLLARIGERRARLADALHLDPEAVAPYVLGRPGALFPSLTAEQIAEVAAGRDRTVLAATIDHTLLKPEARPEQVRALCLEAIERKFCAVCVNGAHVAEAAELLNGGGVQLAAVVGFPLGAMTTAAKAYETRLAVEEGASEIDMALAVGWLKAGQHRRVYEDVLAVVGAAGADVPVKVILETCLLSDDEKIVAGLLSRFAGAAFLKTSTGFGSGGATEADVALLRAVVGDAAGVKASGGVKTFADALRMLKAGANRIGTSSGAAILG